jgi:hypothetical protein
MPPGTDDESRSNSGFGRGGGQTAVIALGSRRGSNHPGAPKSLRKSGKIRAGGTYQRGLPKMMVEQTNVIAKAAPDCARMTSALVAWNEEVGEERRGLQERLATKRRAGQTAAELGEKDRKHYEAMKPC